MRIAQIVDDRSIPNAPFGPRSARKADPTTRVGSTNGMVMAARSSDRPGKSYRAKTYAAGMATMRVRAVETIACHKVNQATPRNDGFPNTSPNAASGPPSPDRPVNRIDQSG